MLYNIRNITDPVRAQCSLFEVKLTAFLSVAIFPAGRSGSNVLFSRIVKTWLDTLSSHSMNCSRHSLQNLEKQTKFLQICSRRSCILRLSGGELDFITVIMLHTYIYICISRERERERCFFMISKDGTTLWFNVAWLLNAHAVCEN